MIPVFELPNGNLNPDAVMCCAVIVSSMYHQTLVTANNMASILNLEVAGFRLDLNTFPPDYIAFKDKDTNNLLVIFAGTTNRTQWVAHFGGAFAPFYDSSLPNHPHFLISVGLGIKQLRSELQVLLDAINPPNLFVAGHSYGAACAHYWALTLGGNGFTNPIHVLTFGELKGLARPFTQYTPTTHNRLIATLTEEDNIEELPEGKVDVVTLIPPPSCTLLGPSQILNYSNFINDTRWRHGGRGWLMTLSAVVPEPDPTVWDNVAFLDIAIAIANVTAATLHYADTSYGPRSRNFWRRGG